MHSERISDAVQETMFATNTYRLLAQTTHLENYWTFFYDVFCSFVCDDGGSFATDHQAAALLRLHHHIVCSRFSEKTHSLLISWYPEAQLSPFLFYFLLVRILLLTSGALATLQFLMLSLSLVSTLDPSRLWAHTRSFRLTYKCLFMGLCSNRCPY